MKTQQCMEFKKLSIKNFIGDLPNIVNGNFNLIKDFIESIFDENKSTLKVKNAIIDNKVTANTVITNNLTLKNSYNNKDLSVVELLERIETLEEKVKELSQN